MKLQLDTEDAKFFEEFCAKYAKQTDQITIEYSGDGDSMDYTTAEGAKFTDEEDAFLTETLFDKLISVAGHDGFWNNEGGQGTVTITLSTGAIALHHEDNINIIIETEETNTDFTIQ